MVRWTCCEPCMLRWPSKSLSSQRLCPAAASLSRSNGRRLLFQRPYGARDAAGYSAELCRRPALDGARHPRFTRSRLWRGDRPLQTVNPRARARASTWSGMILGQTARQLGRGMVTDDWLKPMLTRHGIFASHRVERFQHRLMHTMPWVVCIFMAYRRSKSGRRTCGFRGSFGCLADAGSGRGGSQEPSGPLAN
jgi:hypothetical protein